LYILGTEGKISRFAGTESKCNCLDRGCDCYEEDHYLAATAKFNTISSITISPDGVVHVADQANYRLVSKLFYFYYLFITFNKYFRIRSIMSRSPEATATREYEVYSPTTQELYIFNRFGQHTTTRNILTGETSYQFTYNQFTSSGKLSSVTDAAGNKVFLLRDHAQQVNSIENTKGQKCRLRMSRMKLLTEVNTPDNYNITFDYYGPSGLLRSKLDSAGRSYVYTYDDFGRLTGAVTPTGKLIRLAFDLSAKGATVMVYNDDSQPKTMLIKGTSVETKLGKYFI